MKNICLMYVGYFYDDEFSVNFTPNMCIYKKENYYS